MTLLELIIVLFIIGLVSALVLPRVVGNMAEVQMQGATERVLSACRRARCEAIGTGLVHALNLDTSAGTYWITVESDPLDAPGVFNRVGEAWGRTVTLPERVVFQEVTGQEPEADRAQDTIASTAIHFYPDGRTGGAIICLAPADTSGDLEDQTILYLDPSTGQVRVISAEEREAIETAATAAGTNP
jgi:Tfp pilus assembly protein FimT